MLPGVGVFGTTITIRSIVPILKTCGFDIVALWLPTRDDSDTLAHDLAIPFSTNQADEVLLHKNVDLVIISCAPHLQSQIAIKALNIGKHVICSAPAGLRRDDVMKMVTAARYYPKLLSIMCHGLRFLPTMMRMRSLIDGGYIGEVKICEVRVHSGASQKERYDWTCDEEMGGGVLNSLGSNVIDILSYLTQQKATRVHGLLKTFTNQTPKIRGIREITSDDFCCFQMEMTGNICATVTINTHLPGQFLHEVVMCGTRGRLIARSADLYGQTNDGSREELIHFDPINFKTEDRYGISDKTRREIPMPYLKGMIHLIDAVKDAFDSEAERLRFCVNHVDWAATFEDCLYVQSAVDAIRLSSKLKEWVKIETMQDSEGV